MLFLRFLLVLFVSLLGTGFAMAQSPADLRVFGLSLDNGTKTATATAGAATLNKVSGTVTSEALVTAAGAGYTLTVTDSRITATDVMLASVALGTATTGVPVIATVRPLAGSFVVLVQNVGAAALNGTIKISFVALRL